MHGNLYSSEQFLKQSCFQQMKLKWSTQKIQNGKPLQDYEEQQDLLEQDPKLWKTEGHR
jgi:hypothetical protein